MIHVLFVCFGNICRSPLAEGVFRRLVKAHGLQSKISIDSCGTAPFNVGKPPDPRAVSAAAEHNLNISDLIARQISMQDFEQSDYIVAMDYINLKTLQGYSPDNFKGEVKLLLSYQQGPYDGHSEIPDPYKEDASQFPVVLKKIENACEGLLDSILDTHNLKANKS